MKRACYPLPETAKSLPMDSPVEIGFAMLPADVLSYMANFISLRPRLLVFSVLAKRFRLATLRTVTSLPAYWRTYGISGWQKTLDLTYNWRCLRLFSSLAALEVDEVAMGAQVLEVVPAASLQRLSIRLKSASPIIFANFTHLTCLTVLELNYCDFEVQAEDRILSAFLASVTTSLTSLTLTSMRTTLHLSSFSKQLSVSHFPHLVSLSVSGGKLLPLVQQHASQLTSFSMQDTRDLHEYGWDWKRDLGRMSRLLNLEFHYVYHNSLNFPPADFFTMAPSLQTLAFFPLNGRFQPVPSVELGQGLTMFECTDKWSNPHKLLACCSHLEALTLHRYRSDELHEVVPRMNTLTFLSVREYHAVPHDYTRFPNLHTLCLWGSMPLPPPGIVFPSVRHLKCDPVYEPISADIMQRYLAAFPRLIVIDIKVTEKDTAKLLGLLRFISLTCIEFASINLEHCDKALVAAAFRLAKSFMWTRLHVCGKK